MAVRSQKAGFAPRKSIETSGIEGNCRCGRYFEVEFMSESSKTTPPPLGPQRMFLRRDSAAILAEQHVAAAARDAEQVAAPPIRVQRRNGGAAWLFSLCRWNPADF
jgi:hypothetical protein